MHLHHDRDTFEELMKFLLFSPLPYDEAIESIVNLKSSHIFKKQCRQNLLTKNIGTVNSVHCPQH